MKKVLVVDDTKNIRMLLTTCLEIEGYEVYTASDGKKALEAFDAEIFDLVFLDIKMPEMSGTEVLKRIREKRIMTPVIIITAFPTVKNAIGCTKLGALAYLQKPFTADKVRGVLTEWKKNQISTSIDQYISDIEQMIAAQEYDPAMEQLKKAIAADPTNPESYRMLSRVYRGMGDLENAEKFRQAYEIFKI